MRKGSALGREGNPALGRKDTEGWDSRRKGETRPPEGWFVSLIPNQALLSSYWWWMMLRLWGQTLDSLITQKNLLGEGRVTVPHQCLTTWKQTGVREREIEFPRDYSLKETYKPFLRMITKGHRTCWAWLINFSNQLDGRRVQSSFHASSRGWKSTVQGTGGSR